MGVEMNDSTTAFFDDLGQRKHEPLLQKASGSVRFEITEGTKTERWLLTIHEGDVTVSHKNAAADCLLRADRALFNQVAGGELNTVAAVLRGEIAIDGDSRLLVLVQRLFPRPSGSRKTGRSSNVRRRP
jgi:putative sterol carrier protein